MDLNNKKVLITQPMMFSFFGSVVIAIELAEYLRNCGADVAIYTYILEDPIKSELEKRNIPVYTDAEDAELDLFRYDMIWIHSQAFPECMVRQLSQASENWAKAPCFIFLHMSSADFAPDEFPWIYKFEDSLADKVLYISEKVESTHRNLLEEHIPWGYFRNPAPPAYLSEKKSEKLKKVLIVSNHIPQEIRGAADILTADGICVDFLGRLTKDYRLIQPEDVSSYDAVITIGKTVQYCILSETPVYIYDKFGGPGYLSDENYEISKQWHFCGRGFSQKSAADIAREIKENWAQAFEDIKKIKKAEADLFLLDKVLDDILENVVKREKERISEAQALSVFYAQRFAKYYFTRWYERLRDINRKNAEIQTYRRMIREQKSENDRLVRYLHTVENSPSLRIGSVITFLPRKIREIIHGRMNTSAGLLSGVRALFRPQKICLVTCVYNEERNLPSYLKHVEPYVDFIVILDDGSTDNTKSILRTSRKLRCLIEKPVKTEVGDWNETANREELLIKAQELGADWVLALDPDERLENNFLINLRSIVESAEKNTVYGLHMRALWNSFDQYRIDGIWNSRKQYRLFPLKNCEIKFEKNRKKLHHRWYPDCLAGTEVMLDYNLYHLKSVMPEARVKRAALYNSLDPQKEYQSIGYDFLADDTGLKVQKIQPGREYDYMTVPDYLKNFSSGPADEKNDKEDPCD